MSDKTIIFDVVNTEYSHMQKALTNSMRRNASGENYVPICYNMSKLDAMTCRAKMVLQYLHLGYEKVAWLDADILVRRELCGFWDIEDDKIKILHRPMSGETGKFQTGVFVIGNSLKTRKLMRDWDTLIQEMLKTEKEHFTDQICLWRAYNKNSVEIQQLPPHFNDYHFCDDSPIWHAKGHYKTRSKKWRTEWEKYA